MRFIDLVFSIVLFITVTSLASSPSIFCFAHRHAKNDANEGAEFVRDRLAHPVPSTSRKAFPQQELLLHEHEHRCRFSDPGFADVVESRLFDQSQPPMPNESPDSAIRRRLTATTGGTGTSKPKFESIRVNTSLLDLYNSDKYCEFSGQVRSDFSGSVRTCTAGNVLTAAKRDLLVNVIIPFAVEKLQRVFRVERFTRPLRAPSTDICFDGFTIPRSVVDVGVSYSDYLLVVAAGPDADNVIAWAGGCAFTSDYPVPRIGVGRANFNPKHLDIATTPIQQMLRTALHEILHAFGFTHSYLTYAGLVRTVTMRGVSRRGIVSPLALETARNYFSCDSLLAVELEDEGSDGTANSHLNRRIYKDNLMAGSGGTVLSVIELAILNDVGVFEVNYTEADPHFFGRNSGCGFSTNTACPTTIAQSGDPARHLFCDAATPSISCTSNLEGYGYCSTAAFLTDKCRYYAPFLDAVCIDTSQGNISTHGESYHADSRCFETSQNFKLSGFDSVSYTPRCMQSRCSFVSNATAANEVQVEFRVGSQNSWNLCTQPGQLVAVPGYDGKVVCPSNIKEMCASILSTGRNETGLAPAEREYERFVKSALMPNAVPAGLVTNWTVLPNFMTTPGPNDGGAGSSVSFAAILVVSIFLIIL